MGRGEDIVLGEEGAAEVKRGGEEEDGPGRGGGARCTSWCYVVVHGGSHTGTQKLHTVVTLAEECTGCTAANRTHPSVRL